MTRLPALSALALACTLGLSACATPPPAPSLQGGEWVVDDIDAGGVIDNARATLVFGADGTLSGRATCNRYTSRYEQAGDGLKVSAPAATRMACAPALMNQEDRLLKALAETDRVRFTADGALVLMSGDRLRLKARRD